MPEPTPDGYSVGRRALAGLLGVQLTGMSEQASAKSNAVAISDGDMIEYSPLDRLPATDADEWEEKSTSTIDYSDPSVVVWTPRSRPTGSDWVLGDSIPATGIDVVTMKRQIAVAEKTATAILEVYRANRTISNRDLQLLRIQAQRAVDLSRISALGDLLRATLQELIDTSRVLETMDPSALPYGMSVLEGMQREMRRIIEDF